jgi:5'-deoxynucleotidase YfbR-like HD superfamily hydrolase
MDLLFINSIKNPILRSYLVLSNLENVNRSGWVDRGVRDGIIENDYMHSYGVLINIKIAADLHKLPRQNRNRLYLQGEFHEFGENTGIDIPPHYGIDESVQRSIEETAVMFAFETHPFCEKYLEIWKAFDLSSCGDNQLFRIGKNADYHDKLGREDHFDGLLFPAIGALYSGYYFEQDSNAVINNLPDFVIPYLGYAHMKHTLCEYSVGGQHIVRSAASVLFGRTLLSTFIAQHDDIETDVVDIIEAGINPTVGDIEKRIHMYVANEQYEKIKELDSDFNSTLQAL